MEPWKTLGSRLLLDRSPWLKVHADDVQLPDGRMVKDYLRLETPDFVVIVPQDGSGRIGLIRSYKRGPDQIDLQPPAGMVEPGEAPEDAARRELLEELGCRPGGWQALGRYVLAGNMRGGYAYVYLATDCVAVAPPDSGDLEEQEAVWLDRPEIERIWRSGQLAQLGSVAALGLAFARLDRPQA
jgi:ADP-ribose pyrophosphatase